MFPEQFVNGDIKHIFVSGLTDRVNGCVEKRRNEILFNLYMSWLKLSLSRCLNK